MLVLVEDTTEAVTSVDVQVGDPVRIRDRFGQWRERSGIRDALMRPVAVVEDLELAQRVQEMGLVPDQRCACRQRRPPWSRPADHLAGILSQSTDRLVADHCDTAWGPTTRWRPPTRSPSTTGV